MHRLTAFELSNFDNFRTENVESSFKDKLSLKESKEKKKKKIKHVSSDSDTNEDDVKELEALLARRFHGGKAKYKGKLPIICFNCNEVGHIAARCSKKKNNRSGDKFRSKIDENNKDYKDKGKISCYIIEEESNEDSYDHEDEFFYVAMKDDSNEDEATALVSYVNNSDKWITDSGCSNHMTGDKSKFNSLLHYDGNSVRF